MTKELKLLKDFSEYLKNSNYNTTLFEAEKTGIQLDVLNVEISKDYKNRQQFMSFTFYPTQEDTVKGKYLQIFTELQLEFNEKTQAIFILVLSYFNPKVVLGHFGFNFSNNSGYLKYTAIINQNTDFESLKEIIEMINFTLDTFQPAFKMIESGITNIEEILKKAKKNS